MLKRAYCHYGVICLYLLKQHKSIRRLRSFRRLISLSYGVVLLAGTFHLVSGTVGVRCAGSEKMLYILFYRTQADSGLLSLSWGKLSVDVSSEYCRRCFIRVHIWGICTEASISQLSGTVLAINCVHGGFKAFRIDPHDIDNNGAFATCATLMFLLVG